MSLLAFEKVSLKYYSQMAKREKERKRSSSAEKPKKQNNSEKLATDPIDRLKSEQLRKRLTRRYSNIELVIWITLALIVFVVYSFSMCHLYSGCSGQSPTMKLINKITLMISCSLGLFIAVHVHFKTKDLPDPYSFLLEIKLSIAFPFLSACCFLLLDEFFPRRDSQEIYTWDPLLALDTGFGLMYPLRVIFPCFRLKEVDDVSLKKVLESPGGLILFKSYMVYELSVENLHFYLAATKWKEAFSNFGADTRSRMAANIMNRWIQDPEKNARIDSHYVNLGFEVNAEIRKRIASHEVDETLFDKAIVEVYELMWYNSFARFKKSRGYKRFLGVDQGLEASGLSV
eukprot:snap_masked-scaffold_51-processed-gene-0.15-mRNA-1 protein AED:1.00 eAED:1.00 QI:0/0/0/0/1/1/2/0/343